VSSGARLLLLTSLSIGATSCGVPFPSVRLTDDSAQTADLRQRFPRVPVGTQMTLRAILAARGMELPLTLRIWRKRPGMYRAIFADDLGGTPLHVVQRGSQLFLVARAGMLDERLVRDGLCRDLGAWLFLRGSETDHAAVLADGTRALLQTEGAHRSLRWATTPSGPIDRVATGTAGRLDSTIQLEWDGARPSSVLIENHQFGFTLSLELKEWQPADLTAKTFRTKR
jgi:hypothetical protein